VGEKGAQRAGKIAKKDLQEETNNMGEAQAVEPKRGRVGGKDKGGWDRGSPLSAAEVKENAKKTRVSGGKREGEKNPAVTPTHRGCKNGASGKGGSLSNG